LVNNCTARLTSCEIIIRKRIFAHACFLAQQCGEKALKALWYLYDREPWGHSIQLLVTEFHDVTSFPNLDDWIQRAASLDRYYIPTRYPNGLPDLTPGESYFLHDAESAIEQAGAFVEAAQKAIG